MNEFLRKFDTIRFVASWSIFRNFFGIFSFFGIRIWSFELGRFQTGRYRNRSGPVTPVTAVSGPVPVGIKILNMHIVAIVVTFFSNGLIYLIALHHLIMNKNITVCVHCVNIYFYLYFGVNLCEHLGLLNKCINFWVLFLF